MVMFWMTFFMDMWPNIVMDGRLVHPLAKNLASFASNFWWNIIMDNWDLDEKSLGEG